MSLALPDLLKEQQVVLNLAARDQQGALREITATLARSGHVHDLAAFECELLAREKLQSTATSNGVAFPHARTDLVDEIVLAIGRSEGGIVFEPNARVHLIFVIGTPRRLVSDYLVCIGTLARLLREDALRVALMQAETAAEMIALLKDAAVARTL